MIASELAGLLGHRPHARRRWVSTRCFTVLFALQRVSRLVGRLEDPARDRGYDGQINPKWKALRWTSADFNSVQSKLMGLVTNMMWLSTAARFESAGKSPRRNSSRNSDTPRNRSRRGYPGSANAPYTETQVRDRFQGGER